MNRLTKSTLSAGLILITALLFTFCARANIVDTGKVIKDISFKDVNGKEFTLYSYLDQGYTVVIELGLTTCGICWEFSNSEIFERLYKEYGPTGTVKAKKIMPIFIECNPKTTDADLRGTGSKTMGDWVTGKSFPIIDLTSENARTVLDNFVTSPSLPFGTPTFLVICPDRKVVHTGEGLFGIQEQQTWEIMEKRCSVRPTEIANIIPSESVRLYPNPVIEEVNIHLQSMATTKATVQIANMLGQVFITEDWKLQQGEQEKSIATQNLVSGLYILSITTGQGSRLQYTFMKE